MQLTRSIVNLVGKKRLSKTPSKTLKCTPVWWHFFPCWHQVWWMWIETTQPCIRSAAIILNKTYAWSYAAWKIGFRMGVWKTLLLIWVKLNFSLKKRRIGYRLHGWQMLLMLATCRFPGQFSSWQNVTYHPYNDTLLVNKCRLLIVDDQSFQFPFQPITKLAQNSKVIRLSFKKNHCLNISWQWAVEIALVHWLHQKLCSQLAIAFVTSSFLLIRLASLTATHEVKSKFKYLLKDCKPEDQNQIWTYLKINVVHGLRLLSEVSKIATSKIYPATRAYIFSNDSIVSLKSFFYLVPLITLVIWKANPDVGIVILKRAITSQTFIPLCLPKISVNPLSPVTYVAGWGKESNPRTNISGNSKHNFILALCYTKTAFVPKYYPFFVGKQCYNSAFPVRKEEKHQKVNPSLILVAALRGLHIFFVCNKLNFAHFFQPIKIYYLKSRWFHFLVATLPFLEDK